MGMDESYWDSGEYFFPIFTCLQNGVKVFIDEQMAFLCQHDAQGQCVILKRRQFAVAPLNTLSCKINFHFLPDNFAKAKLFYISRDNIGAEWNCEFKSTSFDTLLIVDNLSMN